MSGHIPGIFVARGYRGGVFSEKGVIDVLGWGGPEIPGKMRKNQNEFRKIEINRNKSR